MERLTIPDVRVDEHTTRKTIIDARAVREHAMDFYWRLKAYEDTELTPEEIDMDHEAAEQLRHLCRDCDLDRLEELAEANRDGRLVVLPCKVGDTVWAILGGKKYACKCIVEYVNIGGRGLGTTIVLCEAEGLREQYGVTVAAFGKTAFLTREEAEAALEATKNE